MVVYIYEKHSQMHNRYSMPTYDDRPHMSAYASDGYLVLMPDIVYEIGRQARRPDCVSSAVKKVIGSAGRSAHRTPANWEAMRRLPGHPDRPVACVVAGGASPWP
jgi:hypothetical protein